jgi:cytoskeleton protein RodZ
VPATAIVIKPKYQNNLIKQPVETDPKDIRPDFNLSHTVAPVTVGAMLREARLQNDLSLEQAAQQLRLSSRQISAMENDEYGKLPDRTYARGFLRNYARLLKLNPEEIVALSPLANPVKVAQHIDPVEKNMGEIRYDHTGAGGDWHKWLIPAILAAVVLIGGTFYHLSQQKKVAAAVVTPPVAVVSAPVAAAPVVAAPAVVVAPSPTEVAAAAAPVAAAVAPAVAVAAPVLTAAVVPVTPAAPNPKAMQFKFAGQSWLEVRDSSNAIIHSQRHDKGGSVEVEGKPPYRLIIGNASQVSMTFKGKAVDLSDQSPSGVARITLE